MRLHCFTCGKSVSNEVPEHTTVRAVLHCPECIPQVMLDLTALREKICEAHLGELLHAGWHYNYEEDDPKRSASGVGGCAICKGQRLEMQFGMVRIQQPNLTALRAATSAYLETLKGPEDRDLLNKRAAELMAAVLSLFGVSP